MNVKLFPDQLIAAKLAFAEIEVAVREYEADRRLVRESATGTLARLLQTVRRHRAFCESIVPVVAARLAGSDEARASITMGRPGHRCRHHMPREGVVAIVEEAPHMMLECLAPENAAAMGWNAVDLALAILECAIATHRDT